MGDLPQDKEHVRLRFLILGPVIGMLADAAEIFIILEDHVSDIISEEQCGDFLVQERILLSEEERTKRKESFTDEYSRRFDNPSFLLYRCFN